MVMITTQLVRVMDIQINSNLRIFARHVGLKNKGSNCSFLTSVFFPISFMHTRSCLKMKQKSARGFLTNHVTTDHAYYGSKLNVTTSKTVFNS